MFELACVRAFACTIVECMTGYATAIRCRFSSSLSAPFAREFALLCRACKKKRRPSCQEVFEKFFRKVMVMQTLQCSNFFFLEENRLGFTAAFWTKK